MTAHCQLEALPGFEFLACAEEHPAEHTDPCCDDGCCALEQGACKLDHQPLTVPPPEWQPSLTEVLLEESDRASRARHAFEIPLPASELVVSWRFDRRAAIPPRAPTRR